MNKKVIIRLMTALTIVGGLLLSSPATSNVEAKPKTFHSISNRGSSLVIDNDDWTFTEECISDGYAPPGEKYIAFENYHHVKGQLGDGKRVDDNKWTFKVKSAALQEKAGSERIEDNVLYTVQPLEDYWTTSHEFQLFGPGYPVSKLPTGMEEWTRNAGVDSFSDGNTVTHFLLVTNDGKMAWCD